MKKHSSGLIVPDNTKDEEAVQGVIAEYLVHVIVSAVKTKAGVKKQEVAQITFNGEVDSPRVLDKLASRGLRVMLQAMPHCRPIEEKK